MKYLKDGCKGKDEDKMAAFLGRKAVISASILLRKAWLGSRIGGSGSFLPSKAAIFRSFIYFHMTWFGGGVRTD